MGIPDWAIRHWQKERFEAGNYNSLSRESIEAAFEGEYKDEGLEQTTIPDEIRTPSHFFLEEVDGEVYPIPKEISLGGIPHKYRHMKDGTLIAEGAYISSKGQVGSRSVIHPGTIIHGIVIGAEIGSHSYIGHLATVTKAVIGSDSTIGDRTSIFGLILPDEENIGPDQAMSLQGIHTKDSGVPGEIPVSYRPFFADN